MRGAIPSECNVARSTLTGGSSRSAATPSVSTPMLALPSTRFHIRSITTAGQGSCPRSSARTASLATPRPGSVREDSGYTGANPAARSSRLRSRSGTSKCSPRRSTMSLLGFARPVSTKLRCRVEISAAIARSS